MIKYIEKNLLQELNTCNTEKVLVDFYADWCGPCQMQSEVLKNFEDIDVIKINIDKYPNIAQEYAVMSIPTLLLFEHGKVIKSNVGFMNISDLKTFIK